MSLCDYGIIVTESGHQVRAICPKCSPERKKKNVKCLAVNTIDGCWFCHHCGWSGSEKGSDFKPVKYEPVINLPEGVIKYFKDRGIPETTLQNEFIGFEKSGGKGWVKFPYYQNSICVNVKYKTATKDFRQEKGGKKVLYRYDRAFMSDKKDLVITEGEMDALACVVSGMEAVSIPDGAPSPNTKNFTTKFDFLNNTEKLFSKFRKIIIAGDDDEPGKRATQELGRRIGVERCYVIKYPEDCKDPNDILMKHGKERLKRVLKNANPFPVDGIKSGSDLIDVMNHEYNNGIQCGEKTGWKNLDELYTVRGGELTIVTGIPGSGKSNFIDALMVNLIQHNEWRFGVFSPENWPLQRHMQTLIEKITFKSFFDTGYGERMDSEDMTSGIDYLDKYIKFILPETEILSVDTILKYARILCLQFGIKGLVIDPWNEVEHNFKNLTETQYISQELTKLRRFARFNGIHIWVIAHPTKLKKNDKGTYDPPTMYDISGGANWRNKADNGICVFRDFQTNETKIIVQKIRFKEIGKLGDTSLFYRYTGNYAEIPEKHI